MAISYTRWPEDLAALYRKKGYWIDVPLFDAVTRHKESDSIAVIDGERSLSYADLNRLSDNLAAGLSKRGIRNGDTALVHIGNAAELYVVYIALLKLGVVPVNALYSHRQNELNAYAKQIQPKLLIGDRKNPLFKDDSYIEHLKTVAPIKLVALMNEEAEEKEAAESMSLKDLINTEYDGKFTPTPTSADEVAFFNLSGGSTGTPKLIPRTHNDYYYSVRQSVVVCEFDENTCYLCAIPAAHNFPMSSPGALGVFYAGGKVVLASDPSVSSCFPLIKKHQVNVAALVPPAASLWLHEIQEKNEKDALSSLKMMQLGGARLSPTLAAKISEHMGCKLQQVFGMAEGLVNYTRLNDDEQTILTTQGRPMCEDDEVWVSGSNGERLPAGEVGLLMTRGPYTFRGYYNAPEHNAKSFDSNGFYCSGDLIAIGEDGNITVHGREKDQINRGGEKISTEEIENLLLRHPNVTEAGLVAMDDELLGEKSCAFVMVRAPVKTVQLRKFLRDQGIAEFKLPDKFKILDEMPLTAVGKVDKKQLRALLANDS